MLPGAQHHDSDLIPRIMRQLWVFLAYVAAARLAILLALPPGYASPVWPAAGIAMAALIVWGPSLSLAVFLGSIATNLRPDELIQNPLDQTLTLFFIALGSTIQAYLGSLIFQLMDRRMPDLASTRRLSLEVLLIGPVACLTAATIGTAALTAFHLIEARMFMSHWISWWLGDSFGAGVFCPLLVRMSRNFYPRQIRMNVAPYLLIPAGLSLLLIAALVLHLSRNNRLHHQVLEHAVTDLHQHMQQDATRILKNLQNLAESSRTVEPSAVMERYAAMEKDGIQLLWVPRVSQENRSAFEASHGHAHQPFNVLEKNPAGHYTQASSRSVHWPLVIKTPHEIIFLPIGFDLGSLPEVAELLQNAWAGSMPLSSPVLTLGPGKKAVLLIQKAFCPEGHALHQGLFIALVTLEQLLKPALGSWDHRVFHIQIQSQDQTPEAAYRNWFGVRGVHENQLRAYGQFQKTLILGSQVLNLQVDFPATAFHGGQLGDPMFVTMLCLLLAFTLNVLIISQQSLPTVVNPEAKAPQDELRTQYETLRDADRNKAQLLANLSHQIRSPLQGILGLLDMLRGTGLDKRQRSSIDTIMANCQSMRLMLDDVHTYASMESGQMALSSDEFLLEDCIRDVTHVYEIAAEERQNEFKSQTELPGMLRVQGDRRRIHRVLSHLLSDAIRRTQKGRISLHAGLNPNQAVLFTIQSQRGPQDEVHDNEWEFGNVKTWEPLEIFNLKICERIIQAMGGGLTLERPDPSVSRVILTLPLPFTLPEETKLKDVTTPYQDVLVVDDNAINLTVAAGLLAKLGYSVETAAGGREALAMIQAKRFDVIFMDCQMPDMDGYDTTRNIRAFHQPERGPWILALTANAHEGARDKAIQSGMDGLIVKPLSLDALLQTIGYAKATPIMDFTAFSIGLGDDPELIQTAIQRYFEEIDGLMARLRKAVEHGDSASVGKTAHTLKGMTSLFAAQTLVEANRTLELAGNEARTDEFAKLLGKVERLTEMLKTELRQLIGDKSTISKEVA